MMSIQEPIVLRTYVAMGSEAWNSASLMKATLNAGVIPGE